MVNKFISQFWVLSAKSVRFNKHTKYTLNIEKYINEKLKGESAIDDLCTNFRRIRMDSIELYEETVNNNKDIVENYLKFEYTRKYNGYQKKKKRNKELPTFTEIFSKVDIVLLFQLPVIDIVENYYLPLQMKENTPLNPIEYYPEARKLHRHFIIHVGGTNTGKTYQSIEKLKKVRSGVYLSPLRLLALEVQENLNNSGVPCNLLTGEERNFVAGANHVSSTVEMLNLSQFYDVAVIDECQMMGDKWRGGHWVKAIMGVLSREVHLCTAPEGLNLIKQIINDCGDDYEVIEHKRTTPLTYSPLSQDFNFKTDVKKGDALVVFSRKSVLMLAAELEREGIKASVIYGALPYDTRKMQMERFIKGETEVVVATDAIGMGLNLPIKRIIFMEVEKFDGETKRILYRSEIKQIAGRAGRRGIYDEGIVSSFSHRNMMNNALEQDVPQITQCYLNFPENLLNMNTDIETILKKWYAEPTNNYFYKQEIREIIDLLESLNKLKLSLTKQEKYSLCTIAFEGKIPSILRLWLDYCKCYSEGLPLPKPHIDKRDLFNLEVSYKSLDLYYGFAQKMNMSFDEDWVYYTKLELSYLINEEILKTLKSKPKKCRRCGKTLSWDYKFNICQECYEKLSFKNYW
jgi:superfamily II DNA/RNA helicase